jgi:hypothetical protein
MAAADDLLHMRRALELAKRAQAEGEVPVGAVVVHDGRIVGEATRRFPPTTPRMPRSRRCSRPGQLTNYWLTGTILLRHAGALRDAPRRHTHARIARLAWRHDPKKKIPAADLDRRRLARRVRALLSGFFAAQMNIDIDVAAQKLRVRQFYAVPPQRTGWEKRTAVSARRAGATSCALR